MRKCLLLGLAIATLGCGSSDPKDNARPPTVAVEGVLSPAPGLAASDFTVWGPADVSPTDVATNGGWSAQSNDHRTGIVFAGPKPGSAAATSLAPESGLYMTPVAASVRLVRNAGPAALDGGSIDSGFTSSAPTSAASYSVASDGPAAMDATTTVIAMLLMHPMLGHASSDVSSEQLRWMATRMATGWPCLAQAAKVYDADLVARVDVSTDAAFSAALTTCLDELSAMPVFTPKLPPATKQAHQRRPVPAADRSGRFYAEDDDDEVTYGVAKHGVVISKLERASADDESVVMTPKTANGTALEYYYTVKEIDDSLTKQGTMSPIFASPNQLEIHGTGRTVAAGFIAASSYWTYLDVVGNTFRKVSGLLSSAVIDAPNNNVTMPAPQMYEVRLFSGGFGIGANTAAYNFATANLSSEHYAALYQNVTMAVVELVGIIPGAGEVLAEGDGGKILQAVVQKVIVELQTLIVAKGANVTGEDLYNMMYTVFKSAVDDALEIVTEDAQAGVAKKLFGFVVSGGKKVFKTVAGLPGKVAKGGTLGNRAFRLSNPESVLEYYVVAVGFPMGDCEPMMKAMSIYLGGYPADCVACANLTCAVACTDCGESCVDAQDESMTLLVDACRICNASGTDSTACSDANLKAMGARMFSPGSGQPQELAYDTYGCIVSACPACQDWLEGPKVCTFPP